MSTELFKGIFFSALLLLTGVAIVAVTASDFRHDISKELPIEINGEVYTCGKLSR